MDCASFAATPRGGGPPDEALQQEKVNPSQDGFRDRKSIFLEQSSQSPDLNPVEMLWIGPQGSRSPQTTFPCLRWSISGTRNSSWMSELFWLKTVKRSRCCRGRSTSRVHLLFSTSTYEYSNVQRRQSISWGTSFYCWDVDENQIQIRQYKTRLQVIQILRCFSSGCRSLMKP